MTVFGNYLDESFDEVLTKFLINIYRRRCLVHSLSYDLRTSPRLPRNDLELTTIRL